MILNEKDYNRLIAAIKQLRTSTLGGASIRLLAEKLRDAKVISSAKTPTDLVTMNSKVLLKRIDNNQDMEISVVYHNDADIKAKKLSVFAPIGMALLGTKEEQIIDCSLPNGTISYKVCKLIYQPESAGHLNL